MSGLRALPSLLMLVFIAINYVLIHVPHAWNRLQTSWSRARRTAGATWDRRMRFTNLTRNRVLVGSQVTN